MVVRKLREINQSFGIGAPVNFNIQVYRSLLRLAREGESFRKQGSLFQRTSPFLGQRARATLPRERVNDDETIVPARKEGRKEGRPRECESRRRKMLAGEAEQRKTRAKEEVGGGVAARSGVGCGTQWGWVG